MLLEISMTYVMCLISTRYTPSLFDFSARISKNTVHLVYESCELDHHFVLQGD